MSFEENLNKANKALEELNKDELSLDESVKIYKQGLEFIKNARELLEKAKLEIKEIDE
ncbi:exodeoxyribonuclease VII small subunit [Campylobacter sp. MIT 12-8780]|uniref:exodeoxyribonuclease VII small subunit n=1 Tax=unclassified Campylobacter TaxID=2593542 RepID=UPI0010F53E45|nr:MULTISPECIES: exodeoxyribonuclease VII small subunit [unclassified Campylobacter]NDJ27488.1 exodeoxyribonuclease VII small subunit [Campylobacter sp. MIT 19-121]TKX28764.1 exodeoxyribonuclease VII small subunit [Campylobacter sp. MIT 12-5580]TQR41247.1 exodeoxyribonuclease VII small subunit [Campylobacter sp. MIT 12-8780]